MTYGIPDDELMKIMEGITVEECDTDMYGMSFTQAKKEYAERKRDEQCCRIFAVFPPAFSAAHRAQ